MRQSKFDHAEEATVGIAIADWTTIVTTNAGTAHGFSANAAHASAVAITRMSAQDAEMSFDKSIVEAAIRSVHRPVAMRRCKSILFTSDPTLGGSVEQPAWSSITTAAPIAKAKQRRCIT